MTIKEKLTAVQNALKAPKNQFNKFGNYHYRNCEDILEALKPLLLENRLNLTICDRIIQIGDRYYVEASAMLQDIDASETIIATAFAREEETKKGMDQSQITGAASSYARKYALNGLFLIDDTKDADSLNNHEKEVKKELMERKSMTSLSPNPEPKPTFTFDDVKEQPKTSAFLIYKNNIEKTTAEGSLNLFLSSVPINPNLNDSEKKELLTIINKKIGKE